MWAWGVLGVAWVAAGYMAFSAFRLAQMADPVNPLAAISRRVRVAIGYGLGLGILALLSLASFTLAAAVQNSIATWCAGGSIALALAGGIALWKWFVRRRVTK